MTHECYDVTRKISNVAGRDSNDREGITGSSRFSLQPFVSHVVCQHAPPTTIKDITSLDRLTARRADGERVLFSTLRKKHLE